MTRNDPGFAEWFWSQVEKGDGCWCWTGNRHRQGYGRLKVNGRTTYAHRIAYELECGPVPSGLKVLHGCDNPPCCNPAHLSTGTQLANVADAVRKGRMRTQRGSSHKLAKATEDVALAIRRDYLPGSSGERSIVGLAKRHGLSKSVVHRIIHRQSWSHV